MSLSLIVLQLSGKIGIQQCSKCEFESHLVLAAYFRCFCVPRDETKLRASGNIPFDPNWEGLTILEFFNKFSNGVAKDMFLKAPKGHHKNSKTRSLAVELFIDMDAVSIPPFPLTETCSARRLTV
jgi:hypothetical protein